jgi:hypothetical protein
MTFTSLVGGFIGGTPHLSDRGQRDGEEGLRRPAVTGNMGETAWAFLPDVAMALENLEEIATS